MMESNTVFLAILCFLLCAATECSIIIRPRGITVREGEYANFSCEVPCSTDVFWFVGDLFNSAPLQYIDQPGGIMYTRTRDPEIGCLSSGNKFENLSIQAMPDLDNVAVQCSIIDAPNCESTLYSRFRLMKVIRNPESTSQFTAIPSSTPTNDHSIPDPTSASDRVETSQCPSPSHVTKTVPETVTEFCTTQTKTKVTTVRVVTTKTFHVPPTPTNPGSMLGSGTLLYGSLRLTNALFVIAIAICLSVLIQL